MVVVAGGDEGRLLAQPLLQVEAEDADVERERPLDVRDLEVDVADVDARIDAHGSKATGSESVTSAPPPGRFRAVASPPCARATAAAIESEACARLRARLVGAGEALEGTVEELRRKSRPGVGDPEEDAVPLLRRVEADGRGAVPECVLDEARERAFEPYPVGLDLTRRLSHLDRAGGPNRRATLSRSACTGMRVLRSRISPSSARTSRSSPSARRTSRSTSSAAERSAASCSAGVRGRRSASSSSVWRSESGVRSSWLASATKRRSRRRPRVEPFEHLVKGRPEPLDLVV